MVLFAVAGDLRYPRDRHRVSAVGKLTSVSGIALLLLGVLAVAVIVPWLSGQDPLAMATCSAAVAVCATGEAASISSGPTGSDGSSLCAMLAGGISLAVVLGSLFARAQRYWSARPQHGWAARWIRLSWLTDAPRAARAAARARRSGNRTRTVVVLIAGWMGVARLVAPVLRGSWPRDGPRRVVAPRAAPARAAECGRAGDRRHDVGRGQRHSPRERPVVSWPRDSAAAPELGQHDRRRTRLDRGSAVGGDRAGLRAHRDGACLYAARRCASRSTRRRGGDHDASGSRLIVIPSERLSSRAQRGICYPGRAAGYSTGTPDPSLRSG